MPDQYTKFLLLDEPSGFVNSAMCSTVVFVVTYPCQSDEMLNRAAFHQIKGDDAAATDWNAPATVEAAV